MTKKGKTGAANGISETPEKALNPSRRQFLKGVAGVTAGITGAALLGSCAEEGSTKEGTRVETPGGRPYTVHSCDVVVVGGGAAGYSAAMRLLEEGVNDIILVDKGKVGHSGSSGQSWGHNFYTNEFYEGDLRDTLAAFSVMSHGLIDQVHTQAALEECRTHGPVKLHEQMGSLTMRYENGEGIINRQAPMVSYRGLRIRHYAQYFTKLGVSIFDNTMVIDITTDESGHVSGIIGINLYTGEAHLYRCKKAIFATGGGAWHSGSTIAGPEATGEPLAIMWKHGAKIKDAEFCAYDLILCAPWSYQDPHTGRIDTAGFLFVNGRDPLRMRNKNLEKYGENFFTSPEANAFYGAAFQGTVITAAMQMIAGNALEGAGVGCHHALPNSGNAIWFDIEGYGEDRAWPAGLYMDEFWDVEQVGYSYTDQAGAGEGHNMHLATPDFYGTQCNPEIDSNTGEVKAIPGLYCAIWTLNEVFSILSWSHGQLSGKFAGQTALEMKQLPSYSEEDVQKVLDKAYGYLENTPENSIRVIDIVTNIRNTFYSKMFMFRDEQTMTDAYNEFERIWKEDLPRMAVADHSKQFNRDWRNAMEVESMLMLGMAACKAGLERKETRPYHIRLDYPVMDNENWLVNIWAEFNEEDASWNITQTPIEDSIISRDEIVEALLPVDMYDPWT